MSTHNVLYLCEAASTYVDHSKHTDTHAVDAVDRDDALVYGVVLGRGGLGEVIECFDRDLRRTVALKRPVETSRSASLALLREAQITAQLIHPSIPAVHAIGADDEGRPWFTMTRLHGQTLKECLSAVQGWSTARRLRMTLRLADAVRYAHHRGVIHRDLKPENVILGDFGEVYLVDWGIAKIIGSDNPIRDVETSVSDRSRPGTFSGTVTYASPEQLRGDPDLDGRSDVYSLGALLHAILVGRPPVASTCAKTIRARVLAGDLELPTPSELPAPLCAVLQKALALERSDRYASVVAFAADLKAFLDHRPVAAYPEGPVDAFTRWYHQQTLSRTRSDKDLPVLGGAAMGAFAAVLAVTPTSVLASDAARGVSVGALGLYAVVLVCRASSIGSGKVVRDWTLLLSWALLLGLVFATVASALWQVPVL